MVPEKSGDAPVSSAPPIVRRSPTFVAIDYAHPPLESVAMSAMWKMDPALFDAAVRRLEQQLDGEWRRETTEAAITATDRRLRCDDAAAVWTSILGRRTLVATPHELTYCWANEDGGAYPHYESVRDGFVSAWDAWRRVADDATFLLGWRIAYLNRIVRGDVWHDVGNWSFFRLTPFESRIAAEFPIHEFHSCWTSQLAEGDGRLDVRFDYTPPSSPRDVDAVLLELAASGSVSTEGSGASEMFQGLDSGRRGIVSAFRRLMTPSANAAWGLNAES